MGWYCDCDDDGDYSNRVTLTKTHADSEGICQKCGHYAFWDTKRMVDILPEVKDFEVTVYDTVTKKTHYYSSVAEAYKVHGFKSEGQFKAVLRREFPHSKMHKVFLLKGIHENAREQFLKTTKNTFVFAYDIVTGKKVTEGFTLDVARKLNISESTVMYNLNKKTQPKTGFTFTTEER